jgi:hypothetical protein
MVQKLLFQLEQSCHLSKRTLKKKSKNVCTACSRASYKIFPLTNQNKYSNNGTSETEVNININVNNGSEKFSKKHCDFR